MSVSYNKLWKLLIVRKLKRTDLIKEAKITTNTLAKMGKGLPVSLESIDRICLFLQCPIEEVVEIVDKPD